MFNIAKENTYWRLILTSLLLMFAVTYITQHAVAKECSSPPSKINLLFDFDWPDASISGLAKKIKTPVRGAGKLLSLDASCEIAFDP